MKTVRALFPLTLLFWSAGYGQDEVFYIYDDVRVPLVQSDTSRAIVLSNDFRQRSADPDNGGLVSSDAIDALMPEGVERRPGFTRLEERYGIVLVRPTDPARSFGDVDGGLALNIGPNAISPDDADEVLPLYQTDTSQVLLVNEFVVRFEPDTAQSRIEEILAGIGGELEIRSEPEGPRRWYTLSFPDLTVMEGLRLVNNLSGAPEVRYAHPNFIRIFTPSENSRGEATAIDPDTALAGAAPSGDLTECTNLPVSSSPSVDDTFFTMQWALHNTTDDSALGIGDADIDAVEAWADIDASGSGSSSEVVIAIIDLGVDETHPDLAEKILTGYSFVDETTDTTPNDWDHHGTGIAGIAAAIHNAEGVAGVARTAKILPIRLTERECKSCDWSPLGAEAEAIFKSVELGAHVLNGSWYSEPTDGTIIEAIEYAVEQGRTVVFAAGNYWPGFSHSVDFPANQSTNYPIIAVSGTNSWDEFKTFNSKDGEFWGSKYGPQVSIAAPAVKLYSTTNGGGYGCFSMTSNATPLVSGAAAVLLSQHPTATPMEIRHWLQEGADDFEPPGYPLTGDGFDEKFGHGRLNLYGALQAAKIDVQLEIAQAGTRIRRGERRQVRVTATRNGTPVPNTAVTISSSDSQYLGVISGAVSTTDVNGVAEGDLVGRSLFRRSARISAKAEGVVATQSVRVPDLPGWAALLLLIAPIVRIARQRL